MATAPRSSPRDPVHDPADLRSSALARTDTFVRSGIIAGLVSVVVFATIHDVFISDIWFSLVPMLLAGALCGLAVAWTYLLLVRSPAVRSWLAYNAVYLALFVALAVASVALFEPMATVGELMAAGGSPGELIGRATPLGLAFIAASAAIVTRLFGGGRRHIVPVLLVVAVLYLFLGHNVAIIGLVEFGASELYLLAEMAGLVFAINAVFVVVVLALERRRLATRA